MTTGNALAAAALTDRAAVTVRRVRPEDAARMRALRLEMLADSPLAFLQTLADAAALPHAEYRARIAAMAAGDDQGQFVAERIEPEGSAAVPTASGPGGTGRRGIGRRGIGRRPGASPFVGHAGGMRWPDDDRTTVLFAVYVTPAYRGTGVLAELVASVAAWSRAAGRPELMLEVVTGNDRAVRAYERLGFVDTGERVPHPTIPVLTEQRMRRRA
ncbi:MAG TPA: GNAT family N-acetyltransferase [Pilimelia sp.]|nr:GNAT family N-acetyltransferase [Pilimelia sp.]